MNKDSFKIFDETEKIKNIIFKDDKLFVLIYPIDHFLSNYPKEKLNRNIYAFKRSNFDLIWQIEECNDGGLNEDKPYMDLYIEDNRVIVGNWIGLDYSINTLNGSLKPKNFDVRPW